MKRPFSKRRARGLTLIELLVSLAIGSLLIIGAVTVYSQSRTTYRVSDTVARLQENARYALSIIEPDVQLAGYYGFSNYPDDFGFIRGGATGSRVSAANLMLTNTAVPVGGDVIECGPNFAVNVLTTIDSGLRDNQYGLQCAPASADGSTVAIAARNGADSLTIRHASVVRTNAAAGRVQLIASRLGGNYIFSDGTVPTAVDLNPDMIEVRDLIVRTYYVATNSETPARVGLPSLRVKRLAPGPTFVDEEVISGVEDLQVQYGIAPLVDKDFDGDPETPLGSAVAYVSPPVDPAFRVVSIRLWLMMRAEQAEPGFIDNNTYEYGGKSVPKNDKFRRVLVSRTIQLRNSRML